MGKEGQKIPDITDEKVEEISNRYIELFEQITGKTFTPKVLDDDKMYDIISSSLLKLR